MCGRYVIARAVGDLVAATGAVPDESLGEADTERLRANWNTAPTTDVPIVLERLTGGNGRDDGELVRELHVARWGLVPGWAKDPAVGSKMFNARSETVLEKPSFRKAVRARRCAVPANGYYEWKKEPGAGKGGRKQPYYVHPADPEETIWFAGIYEWWHVPDDAADLARAEQTRPGKNAQDDAGRWLLSCSILTREAPDAHDENSHLAALGALHNRLPMGMTEAFAREWITPDKDHAPELVDRAVAGALEVAAQWRMHAVSTDVGSVKSQGEYLVEPLQTLL